MADGIDTSKVGGAVTTVTTGKSLTIDANSKQIGATPADPDHFVQADNGKIYGTNAAGTETYEATIDKATGKVTSFSTTDSGAVTGLTGAKTVSTVGEEVTATGDTTGLKSYDGGKSYIIRGRYWRGCEILQKRPLTAPVK